MERLIYNQLVLWKNDERHKPLILLGARQVGKTYILNLFGKQEFDNYVYVNCHNNDFTTSLFRSISTIILSISKERKSEVVKSF